MSKRIRTDSAVKNAKNYHPTPYAAAAPLGRILPPFTRYVELCAGDGRLINHLGSFGHVCEFACDVQPRAGGIFILNALSVNVRGKTVITNPPFDHKLLAPMLDAWVGTCEVWLLLPLDKLANLDMQPYMAHVAQILPIGRVSWMENGVGGYENYAWFNFKIEPQDLVLRRIKRNTKVKP